MAGYDTTTKLFVDGQHLSAADLAAYKADERAAAAVLYAPLISPAFNGVPTAPTATSGTNTLQIATTAFVQAAVVASTTGVAAFNTRTGAVSLTLGDVTGVLGAGLAVANGGTGATSNAAARTNLGAAPLDSPVFTTRLVLPTWTTSARPGTPVAGTEGYATDTNRRETWNGSTWVQYVRATDIPAASGQLLGGSGTAGAPTAITLGTNLSLSGTTLNSTAGAGLPTTIDATLNGASGQTVITPTHKLVYLSPDSSFTDSSPAPYTLANGTVNGWIDLVHTGVGVAGITANVNGSAGTVIRLYPGDIVPVFYDASAGTYRGAGAQDVGALLTAGAAAGTDVRVTTQAGIDKQTTLSADAAFINQTPAGSRSAGLPVVLTATDHNKNVMLIGGTGSLSPDGTVPDGFRCHIINGASGVATYSGITGLLATTSLSSGASCVVMKVGGTVYATASSAAVGTATTYSQNESAASGLNAVAVTVTYAPTSGAWPSGVTLTPAVSGVTGTWSPTTLSPTGGSLIAVSATFTPSSTGTATLSVTSGGAMTNPSSLTYTVNTTATSYTTGLSASSGLTGVAMTMTFTPGSGAWPASEIITPTVSGVTGTFSPTTIPASGTGAVTCTFTPTSGGTASLSSTTSPSLTNTTGAQNYTVTVANATAYTTSLNHSSGAVGSTVTATFTPNGTWPVAEAITLTTTLTGSWGSASGGSLSGSVLTPTAGSSACSAVFTPTAAAVGSINSTTSPSITNTSGSQTYTVLAVATAFGTSPTTVTVASGSPTTLTFTPTGGVWGPTTTIGIALVTVAGAFSGTTNGSISGGTITPTAGNSTAVTIVFTPSSSNGTNGSATISGTNITATNTSVSISVGLAAPSYPTLTSSGIQRVAIWDANAGVSASGGSISALADQTVNVHNLAATVGVSVGATVNSVPSIAFASANTAANSGLRATPSPNWLTSLFNTKSNSFAFVHAFKAKTLGSTFQILFDIEPTTGYAGSCVLFYYGGGDNKLYWRQRGPGTTTNYDSISTSVATSNAVHTIAARYEGVGSGANTLTVWINGTKVSTNMLFGDIPNLTWTDISFGQGATAVGLNAGAPDWLFLESHVLFDSSAAISDSDINLYVTPSTGYFAQKWGA